MKRTTLLKTLLVAVLLGVGASNAWADVIYSWKGGSEGATETGGTAAVTGSTDALNEPTSTVAGTLYVMKVASKLANIGTANITITLDNALQEGDIVRVSGFQNKNASDKVVALYLGFKNGDTDKGNITETSDDNWVNLCSGYNTSDAPEIREYSVNSALAGSNKIVLTRSQAGTNLWISKVEVVRPVVNANIDFSNAITDGSVAGTVNSMSLSGSPFEITNGMLHVGNGTGTVTIPEAQYTGTRDEIVITFDMYFGNLSGKNAGFYLYDNAETPAVIGALYCSKYSGTEVINSFGIDRSKITAVGSSKTTDADIAAATNKSTFEIHLNYASGTMYVKQSTNGTLKQTTEPVAMGSTKPLKRFVVQTNYNTRYCWFDNLIIKTIDGNYDVATANYKVYFQDESGTDLKEYVTRNGDVGTNPVILDSDKETFYDNDVTKAHKYVYKENDFSDATIASDGSSVYTVTFKTYTPFSYSLKYKLGEADAVEQASGTLDGDLTTTVYYPVCREDALGNYYTTSKNNATPYFGVVFSSSNKNVTINYTADPNIVYYEEAEDMGGSRYNYNQSPSRTSNGGSWCSAASDGSYIKTNWGNSINGYYDIEIGMANRDYAVNPTPKLMTATDDPAPTALASISLAATSYTQKTYYNQQITTGQEIYIFNDNGSNASKWALDYIILRETPATASPVITAVNYGTFSSPYALNFGAATGVYAYYTTAAAGGKVTMTKVTGTAAANEGLFIEKGEGAVSIPVVASGATLTGNKLKAGGVTAPKDSYVFAKQGEQIGFYKLGAATAIPAGKAYLEAGTYSSSRLAIVFDDETTGISELKQAEQVNLNEAVYNLRGQRVAQPAKGLFIVNGKKVVMK